MTSGKSLRVGLAGLGTVGGGVAKLLSRHADMIEQRCGRRVELAVVSARDEKKAMALPLGNARFVKDAAQLADDCELDVIVEVIGGSEGVARTLVEKALSRGVSVVTANKALIAHHGLALAQAAEKTGATLAFEAAVAGGIPIIKGLRDGLAANRFGQIVGILNGTCNYILTRMRNEKLGFEEVLKDAQRLGYAEAEPSFDVDGIDTAHKLAILASMAFGFAPAIDQVRVEGIRRISLRDMEFAEELGYRIKLLGIASVNESGVSQRVHPCMVPLASPLANVHDVYNAVAVQGDAVGKVFFEGRGAGEGPTASSVVADIMDIARGVQYKPFTLPVASLKAVSFAPAGDLRSAFYLRLSVTDKPGVLADVTGIFRDQDISVHSVHQHSHQPGESVQVVLTTHETTEGAMSAALAQIEGLSALREKPYLIRVENL